MPLEFKHLQLTNSLDVIAECNTDAHTAAVGFFVKTGARDEQIAEMGVSHFLEHMMFKGTARRTADDVNREFDEIGANYNAFTSHENTVYYAQVLPEFLPRAIDLLGDMLRPALRVEDFDMEKKVIIEEIGMYDDRPMSRLHDNLLETHFPEHGLGYRVLGTEQSVGDLTADQMLSYFNKRYSPDNITVAAAGKIDFDKLIDDVQKITESWQPSGVERQYLNPTIGAKDITVEDERVSRHYMAMMCTGPTSQDDRRYTARVLADVLGDSDGSRLYWALLDPGLADDVDFSHYPQDQVGSYYADLSCDPDRAEQVEKILFDTIDTYVDSVQDDEIERAKNKLATQATLAGENPGGRMRGLGADWVYLHEYRPLAEQLEMIMKVTVQDVQQLLHDMPFTPRTIVRLTPKK